MYTEYTRVDLDVKSSYNPRCDEMKCLLYNNSAELYLIPNGETD